MKNIFKILLSVGLIAFCLSCANDSPEIKPSRGDVLDTPTDLPELTKAGDSVLSPHFSLMRNKHFAESDTQDSVSVELLTDWHFLANSSVSQADSATPVVPVETEDSQMLGLLAEEDSQLVGVLAGVEDSLQIPEVIVEEREQLYGDRGDLAEGQLFCDSSNYEEYITDFRKINALVRQTGCEEGLDCVGKGCQLQNMDFSGRDLRNKIFNYANLSGANFDGAKITHAKFVKVDATGAQLTTDLDRTNFRGAKLDQALYDDQKYVIYNFVYRLLNGYGISDSQKSVMTNLVGEERELAEMTPDSPVSLQIAIPPSIRVIERDFSSVPADSGFGGESIIEEIAYP